MQTQPLINQLQGAQWVPLQRNNWHLATQLGNANALAAQLKALGVADAQVIDMTGYTDAQGNFHNDIVGMFQYLDGITKFFGITGTLKVNPGTPNEVDIPIYDVAGDLWDRMAKPNAFFDKPAPVTHNPTVFWPNGPVLKIAAYPDEDYATLYWSAV